MIDHNVHFLLNWALRYNLYLGSLLATPVTGLQLHGDVVVFRIGDTVYSCMMWTDGDSSTVDFADYTGEDLSLEELKEWLDEPRAERKHLDARYETFNTEDESLLEVRLAESNYDAVIRIAESYFLRKAGKRPTAEEYNEYF